MAKVRDMTEEELGFLVESKLLELIGDPDSGLSIKDDFKKKLAARLKDRQPSKRISHKEAMKRLA